MALKFICIIVLFSSHIGLSLSGETKVMESVPDLYNSMYKVLDSFPCVRLLNLSGEIGCSNPGRQRIVAPIIRFKDANTLSRSSTILLSIDEVQSFFVRLKDDSSFAQKIGGVLIEAGTGSQDIIDGFSPAHKFPQAEFASYRSSNYEWNPTGSGIMLNKYNFPVFLLSVSGTITIQEAVLENEKKKISHTSAVAEFDLVMQTMKSGNHDSESCLKEGTCLPLGGYSVWSALQPIDTSSSNQGKPVILTVASMDSASFFRDKSIGAESPISGLISLLAAVEALSRLDGLDLKKQLVFLVLTGESWGYVGSRRFLHELDLQSDVVTGLNGSLFDVVVEVGSVGKGFNQGANKFYAHDTGGSSGTKIWHALKQAEDSLKSENISVSTASTSNPGIPPSSLMPFLRKNPLTSGVVLEDFDTVFSNKLYNSHLDDSSNVNTSSVVAAASLLARTLYTLATDSEDLTASTLASINVNVSLVHELMGCLISCGPGLSCELVRSYIVPSSSSACPSHYVGVMIDEPSSTPPKEYVSDVSRFVWNFLADKTSVQNETTSSVCSKDCSSNGGLCIRAETDGKGVCVFSTTRYVPAYSTRLEIKDGTWVVLPPNTSDPMGIIDPVWTESNWNTIGLRVYTVHTGPYDYIVLLAGVAITALAYVAIVMAKASIAKMMKLD